jgi:HEAT repeat
VNPPDRRDELPLAERPAVLVALAVQRWGEYELMRLCTTLLRTTSWGDEPDLLLYLGGRRGPAFLDHGLGREGYWLRSWSLRAMLYAWDESAAPAVVEALGDEHWRVREMAAKVVALRQVGSGADAAAALVDDPVPRVRAAAARVLGAVGESEHAAQLTKLVDDLDPAVSAQAERALTKMARRLDRSRDELLRG